MIFFYFLFCNHFLVAQVKVFSWNLQNFGKTKTEAEINFIATILTGFDIIALQEVVSGYGGAQAVAKLADELNRKGSRWDYVISEPTNSSPYATERYAFLWKTSRVKRINEAWLEHNFANLIDREPYLIDFNYNGNDFTLVNFHAIPKKKRPETEIKHFKWLPSKYPAKNLIFLGDFNVPQSHTVFNPLKKMGFLPVFIDQKTTMKMVCVEDQCLGSDYDNIFFDSKSTKILRSGVVLFYKNYPDMVSARRISDHIPIWAEFEF